MPWHPPIPAGKLYSPPALQLGPGLALLIWCYDGIQRDGSIEVRLDKAAADLNTSYRTIRNWWLLLRDGPFFCEQIDRGRRGWVVRMAEEWIDWRVMGNNYPRQRPDPALERTRSTPGEGQDLALDDDERPVNARSTPGEGQDLALHHNVYKEDHLDQKSDLSNGGGNMTRARASEPTSRPPPPLARADQELPRNIAQSAADWLDHPLKTAERRQLLALLNAYGADWLEGGLNACIAQGGRSLNYLTKLLEGCRRDNRPPGSPKTHEHRNGTHQHQSNGSRQHPRPHSERARWSEADLDQPL